MALGTTCAVMQDAEVDQAKMQVQGQMAAQYIQDVMQVTAAPPRAGGFIHATPHVPVEVICCLDL